MIMTKKPNKKETHLYLIDKSQIDKIHLEKQTCTFYIRPSHSHFRPIILIFALLRIQFHHILHGNPRMIATHHISHFIHCGGDRLISLLSHMNPLINH